eukprot:77826-Pyramimonas_sp.AAC.1
MTSGVWEAWMGREERRGEEAEALASLGRVHFFSARTIEDPPGPSSKKKHARSRTMHGKWTSERRQEA